ncbi:digeranylgeranylglycerophospholipid reductase [Halorhabdus sp. CUG00001]|uniref:digeranylgeranylglycerophospholipid reductase n=1 Tax=Halorhabdus sp. CUG00001 TaxID=2600297 RepID=UPI00131CF798|nr:digeranylgeranylglycerophospholipid reductase [Halorhabdus sp. CUG00001]
MSERYDAVIAGAGPAGAQCARDLARRGYDVVVLETEAEADFPRQSNKSTGGTFPSMLSSFGIPDDVVMQFTDSVVIESPSEYLRQTQTGAVLDFAAFKQFLVADSRENGANYRFDARVSGPVMENGEVAGVRYNGSKEVHADVVIDATGPAAPIASELGVSDLERERHAIGIEYEMAGVDLDPDGYADLNDAMMLRLDHEYAPGGYAWIFHTGQDTAKVGLCYINNDSYQRYAQTDRTIDGYLQHWLDTDPRFADATQIEGHQHRGSAHIQHPGQMSTDNFIAIGDTVPSIDPLWGEGIHNAMKSGRAAAVTVDQSLTPAQPDTSAEAMAFYETLWHREVAPRMDARLRLTEMLYLAPNDRYDRLLLDLNGLDDETLARANNGSWRAIAKLIHVQDVPLLAQFAKEQLA